jgi:hypothetical protein
MWFFFFFFLLLICAKTKAMDDESHRLRMSFDILLDRIPNELGREKINEMGEETLMKRRMRE